MGSRRSYVTEALVLRTIPFAETSQVVHLATGDHGMVAALAKGAMRPRPEHEGGLSVGTIGEAQLTARRGAELELLRRFRRYDRLRGLGRDLTRFYAASWVLEILRSWMRPGLRSPILYRAAVAALEGISRGALSGLPFWVVWFEARAVSATGHRPVLDGCAACSRPEPPGTVFAPAAGGVVHAHCSTLPPRRRLASSTRLALGRIYGRKLGELVAEPPGPREIAEIRAVHDLWLPHLLERRPQALLTVPK